METDQTEQLDVFLNQSTKVLNEECDTEDMDTSTTSKQDIRSPSHFDSKNTQAEIIIAEKRDINLVTSRQQLGMTGESKFIVMKK